MLVPPRLVWSILSHAKECFHCVPVQHITRQKHIIYAPVSRGEGGTPLMVGTTEKHNEHMLSTLAAYILWYVPQ